MPEISGGWGVTLCPEIFRSLKVCYLGKKSIYLSLDPTPSKIFFVFVFVFVLKVRDTLSLY